MSSAPDTIMLMHGLWMTPRSWEKWTEHYARSGYRVLAPPWPGLEGEVESVRRDPSALEGLGVTEVVDHYDRMIRKLDGPPILMGHSYGGLFVQILLDRGLGAAGVAIDSAPAKGVRATPSSTVKANWPVLSKPGNRRRAVPLTPEQFHFAFTNTLTDQESAAVYERYAVPGSGRMVFEGAFANVNPKASTQVNFRNGERAPLLFVAGDADNIIPPAINKANVRKYRKSAAVTDYIEFPGRSHFIVGQDGWQEIADYALRWATTHTGAIRKSGKQGSTPTAATREQ